MTPSRRTLLAATVACVAGPLAGCTAPTASPDAGTLAVTVSNRSGVEQPVDVTVTDPGGTVVEEVADAVVPADTSRTFESTGYAADAYTVRVRGPNWATSGWWDRGACSDHAFETVLEEDERGTPSVSAEATCPSNE